MDIGARLHALCSAKGLSLGEITRRSGLSRSHVGGVESHHAVPSLASLEKLSKALGVEPYQLLMGEDKIPKLPAPKKWAQPALRLIELGERISDEGMKLLLAVARKIE